MFFNVIAEQYLETHSNYTIYICKLYEGTSKCFQKEITYRTKQNIYIIQTADGDNSEVTYTEVTSTTSGADQSAELKLNSKSGNVRLFYCRSQCST
jgi:hypothetical protein